MYACIHQVSNSSVPKAAFNQPEFSAQYLGGIIKIFKDTFQHIANTLIKKQLDLMQKL